jgi:hypothetical protein
MHRGAPQGHGGLTQKLTGPARTEALNEAEKARS